MKLDVHKIPRGYKRKNLEKNNNNFNEINDQNYNIKFIEEEMKIF